MTDRDETQNGKQGLQLDRTIVLVGMMGSGKTAIGRALALRLNVPFLDSDAALEEAAASTISDIFERDGEAFFRDREAEVIHRLITGPACVLSTGGGAFLASKTRETIETHATSVWLDADIETLWARVKNKDTRPLLRTDDPRATLASLFAKRTPIYQQAAVHVPVDPLASIEETTDRVVSYVAKRKEAKNG